MTQNNEREAFENWYESRFGKEGLKTTLNHPYLLDGEYLYESTKDKLLIWTAATAEANKRIAELEGEVAELKSTVKKWQENSVDLEYSCLDKNILITELQASNHTLCEALQWIDDSSIDGMAVTKARKVLADMKHRKEVITELQATNNVLREALQEAIGYIPAYTVNESVVSKWRSALTATPAESLAKHDDELIERCAKVLDVNVGKYGYEFVKDIRALKGNV